MNEKDGMLSRLVIEGMEDLMNDAHQARYDYDGGIPENEDPADWKKPKLKGCVRVG